MRLIALGLALTIATPLFPVLAFAADQPVVHIDNFTFGPQTITVPKGGTVEWDNRDDTPHRVVSSQNQFKSPVLDTDEKFHWTFSEAGSFPYFCSLHPQMTGTVVVTGK